MIILENQHIYGNDNIEVTQDSESKKHAMLRHKLYLSYKSW